MSLGVSAEETRLVSCKLEGCTFYDAGELTDDVVYYLRATMDILVRLVFKGGRNQTAWFRCSQCPTPPRKTCRRLLRCPLYVPSSWSNFYVY